MSENEDFESLKVTELQNELKKRGLDTKGRKADLITRLREAINNGVEAENSEQNDEESPSAVIKDETSSPSSPIEDDDEDENVQEQPQPMEETDLISSKKRSLDESQVENVQNPSEETDNDDPEKLSRKKKSRWGNEEESEEKQSITKPTSDEEDNSSSTNRDRDYHRSYNNRRTERSPEKELPLPEEETVQFNPEDVVLDFYTSNLNLTINSDCLSASSKSNDALCFLWAGTRTTYGFKQGRICYEIRITEILDCPDLPESEKEKFGIRIGWSNLSAGLHALQLGEINDSFAYTSNGMKMCKINDELTEEKYGETFGQSDVIGCYIDFGENENENLIKISFTKNGEDYGQAFEIDKNRLNNENQSVFYPHILVKNIKFECNFGQFESSWSEMKSDYVFTQNIPLEERIRSVEAIVEKSDCQVVFVSGLICSGKTTWANKYIQDNPTKYFQLINVESVLNQMTIDGKLPFIKDRNDGTMLRVNVCLQKLIEIAGQRRRNFIIDHVNTTREIQLKRQRLFTGYRQIGVVIVPDDEEYRRRIEKVEKLENITIPSQWIRDAKSRFNFLQKSSTLEDVIYPELQYDDAKSLFEKARRDSEQYRSSSSRYDRHDDYRSSRHERNRYDDRDRDRDRYDRRDRSRSRERRSRDRDRDRDRRGPRDDSRYSSSSRRNDNYGGGGGGSGHNNNNYRGGGYSRGGGGGYSDYRQDSRNNNNYNQRGGGSGGGGGFHGRGGNNNNQSNDNWRGGYQQQQRNDYGSRGRGGNQFNNRGSYHDNQRSSGGGGGDGGFRSDFNNQQRHRQFNDYDNSQHQNNNSGFMQNNNNNFNQQNDRQGFGSRPSMPQQQQNQYQNQQRPQPLLQTPPTTQQPFGTQQQQVNNPNLALQTQNSLGINPTGVTQSNSIDSWLALCAAALNPQATAATTATTTATQPQSDVNALSQQWSQWLKTAQMTQTAQQQQQAQAQPQLNIQPTESQANAIPDATALYYQAYYAQLAAAQQQAAAAAAAAAAAPQNNNDK